MVRVEVLRKRLNKLDEYLEILHGLRKYNFETFIGNPEHYGSAERFLHLSIEAVNDIGNHIIADDALDRLTPTATFLPSLAKRG